jgi:hypothetical protein
VFRKNHLLILSRPRIDAISFAEDEEEVPQELTRDTRRRRRRREV